MRRKAKSEHNSNGIVRILFPKQIQRPKWINNITEINIYNLMQILEQIYKQGKHYLNFENYLWISFINHNPAVLINLKLIYDYYYFTIKLNKCNRRIDKRKKIISNRNEVQLTPEINNTNPEISNQNSEESKQITEESKHNKEESNQTTEENTESITKDNEEPVITIEHVKDDTNDNNEMTFNIIINRAEDVEERHSSPSIPKFNSKDIFSTIYKPKSNSFSSFHSKSNVLKIDDEKDSETNEKLDYSIKNKSIEEIYDNYKKFCQTKTERHFKHSDVNKLKNILISKGKYDSSKNIFDTFMKSEK